MSVVLLPDARFRWLLALTSASLTTPRHSVAVVIASHADWSDGENVWPALATIADEAKQSLSTAKRTVKWLRDEGWLVRTGWHPILLDGRPTRSRTAIYRLAWPANGGSETRESDTPISADPRTEGQKRAIGGSESRDSDLQPLVLRPPVTAKSSAGRSEIANGDERDILALVEAVLAHFIATRARYGEKATATDRRHRFAGIALRSYSVAEIARRIDELHAAQYHFDDNGNESRRLGRLRCDLGDVLTDLTDDPPSR